MLEEIIKNNLELSKHPSIIPILQKIETIIPPEVRTLQSIIKRLTEINLFIFKAD